MDSRTTVFSLFNGLVQFVVPEYQRAYSWHVKQNNEQDKTPLAEEITEPVIHIAGFFDLIYSLKDDGYDHKE